MLRPYLIYSTFFYKSISPCVSEKWRCYRDLAFAGLHFRCCASHSISFLLQAADGALDIFVHTMLISNIADEHAKGKLRYRDSHASWRKSQRSTQLSATDFLRLRPCKFTAESQTLVDWNMKFKTRARHSWIHKTRNNFYSIQDFLNIYRSRYSMGQVS